MFPMILTILFSILRWFCANWQIFSRLEPAVFPSHSVFVDHRYLQNDGAEYLGPVSLRYHFYLVPEDLVLPDTILFANQWSLKTASNADPEVDFA